MLFNTIAESTYADGAIDYFISGETNILPGMFVSVEPDGSVRKAGGNAGLEKLPALLVIEDIDFGMSFDDAYEVGMLVKTRLVRSGDKVILRSYHTSGALGVGNVFMIDPTISYQGFSMSVGAGIGLNSYAMAINEEPIPSGNTYRNVLATIV